MIDSLTIAHVASYGAASQALAPLAPVNFLFGSNGTGKTTISRILAQPNQFPTCQVTWKGGRRLHALVYNRDFVDRNFNQSKELRGIFTLGEKHVDALARIGTAKTQLDAVTRTLHGLTQSLEGPDGKEPQRAAAAAAFEDKVWSLKRQLDGTLAAHAFKGVTRSKDQFKRRLLEEAETNRAPLLPLPALREAAETVFADAPTPLAPLPAWDAAPLLALESHPILAKTIFGKTDVDIAALIQPLNNSDWVRHGRAFLAEHPAQCPFCQQPTPSDLPQKLNAYFDASFEADTDTLRDVARRYAAEADRCRRLLAALLAAPVKHLDAATLATQSELFHARVALNLQTLDAKIREPSQPVALQSLAEVAATLEALIQTANAAIADHNRKLHNLASERAALTSQIWAWALHEIRDELATYSAAQRAFARDIDALRTQIDSATAEANNLQAEIRLLEKQTTSVQPTVDGINQLLASFGFQSFQLAKSARAASYTLVRPDGSDAKDTLSEGERTFVTFLYFFHLLRGSHSESDTATDRVVVFDDPVSSLDSDILFIIGSLIKTVCDEARLGTGPIKQVFILTHNVFFHKEITHKPPRAEASDLDETFWILRKHGPTSHIERHPSNPVKTSYELLWSEVRNPHRSHLTIQNTLRRILENYFRILGGIDLRTLSGMFEGKERLVFNSLCAWVHDGSHYAPDDLYVSIDDTMVATYLDVFRAIFQKSGHQAHYDMMLGRPSPRAPNPLLTALASDPKAPPPPPDFHLESEPTSR